MLEQVTPYKPKNLAEDMILCAELREKGSKVTGKRLAKEQKGTYPQTGTPAECSVWWMQFKEGKKKDKMAMVVMASHYNHVVKLLDMWQSEMLQLKAKTKSQEEEIKLLKLKLQQRDEENRRLNYEMFNNSNKMLQLESKTTSHKEEIKLLKLKLLQWEEENMQLNYEMSKNSSKVLQLKSETDSLKEEITSVKLRVQEQNAENEQLKNKIANYNPSSDDSKNSLRLPVPVTRSATWQRSLPALLKELPDLQYDNSNHEFWTKIKSWLLKGEVDPKCVFKLVKTKCPLKAWQATEENFDNKDLTEMAFSNPAAMGRLLEKLWKCVSEALGPGTKLFELYYYRRQEVGETFEEYFQEKFRLYCSYGVDNTEPNKNDQHFLCNVIEKAAKSYQALESQCPKSYTDLLTKAMFIDRMLTTAEFNNECLNCGRKGHTKAQCRRPGGDAEVGPNQCFTCGRCGHWARNCWT